MEWNLIFRALVNDIYLHRKIQLDQEKLNFEADSGYKLVALVLNLN